VGEMVEIGNWLKLGNWLKWLVIRLFWEIGFKDDFAVIMNIDPDLSYESLFCHPDRTWQNNR